MAAEQTDTGRCEMGRPFVSVLMPAYNCASSITAAMGSVLCETRVPLELIVVDDASTDATPALIDMMAEGDPRVRVVHRAENGGDGPARNTGLDLVRGEWLVLLDPDDVIEKGALARLAPILAASEADVAIDRYSVYDVAHSYRLEERGAFREDLVGKGAFDPKDMADELFSTVWPVISNKIFRMERIHETGLSFQEIPRVGDLYFTLGACALARRIEFIDAEHYLYRVNHGESLTWTGDAYPLCFAQAAYALQDLLIEKGLWDSYKQGFRDWFVTQVTYNLTTMRSYEGYEALAREFCETSFDRIGLAELDRSDCSMKDRYDVCMRLWKEGPDKGLFSVMMFQFADADDMRRELVRMRAQESQGGASGVGMREVVGRAKRRLRETAQQTLGKLRRFKVALKDGARGTRDLFRYSMVPAAKDVPVLPVLPDEPGPFVSLIVPVYNAEPFLRFCLDSIRNQSFSNFEAILIDDGSTDSSGAICDEYAAADSRFRCVHQKNRGLSAARNVGIELAQGSWLSFVDADDCIYPEFITCMLSAALGTGSSIAICAMRNFILDAEFSIPGRHGGNPSHHQELIVRTGREMCQKLGEFDNWYYVTAWGKIFDRTLFEELRFPEGRLYEDEFTIPKAFYACDQAVELGRVLYGYRHNRAGITLMEFSLKRCDRVASQEEKMAFFLEVGEYECAEDAKNIRECALDRLVDDARDHGLYDDLPERYRMMHARRHAND